MRPSVPRAAFSHSASVGRRARPRRSRRCAVPIDVDHGEIGDLGAGCSSRWNGGEKGELERGAGAGPHAPAVHGVGHLGPVDPKGVEGDGVAGDSCFQVSGMTWPVNIVPTAKALRRAGIFAMMNGPAGTWTIAMPSAGRVRTGPGVEDGVTEGAGRLVTAASVGAWGRAGAWWQPAAGVYQGHGRGGLLDGRAGGQ